MTESDAIRVTVAIPSRDRPDSLCRVVRDACGGHRRPDEIVVICQGRRALEAARRLVREVPEALPLLRFYASSRTGVAAARNDAIRQATGQFIAFSDDDMRLPQAWLASMLDVWRREWDAGPVLLTGPIDAPEGAADAAATPGHRPGVRRRVWHAPPRDGDVLYGGHFGAPRNVYERAGSPPFDERLGPGTRFRGGEDEVFAFRVLRAGVPITFDPAIRATHMADETEWIRSQFRHSRGAGALFVLRWSLGDRAAPGAAVRTVFGIAAKGVRVAMRRRFREAAGRFAAIGGMVAGALLWWTTGAGRAPSASEPRPGDLRFLPLGNQSREQAEPDA
ncbi:MAG: glycosyltransferase [Gemmatimonadota bacterium]